MELKDVFGEIEADGAHLVHGRLLEWALTPPLWHAEAVGGRPHHQGPHGRHDGRQRGGVDAGRNAHRHSRHHDLDHGREHKWGWRWWIRDDRPRWIADWAFDLHRHEDWISSLV